MHKNINTEYAFTAILFIITPLINDIIPADSDNKTITLNINSMLFNFLMMRIIGDLKK